MIELTQENFAEVAIHASKPVLVEFGAVWCAPCKRLEPELEKLVDMWKGKFILAHINVDDDPDLAMQFNVMSVPTTIMIKNGSEVERFIGFKPLGKIIELLEGHIN